MLRKKKMQKRIVFARTDAPASILRFILPGRTWALPVRHRTVAVIMKLYKVKRHYEASHKLFAGQFFTKYLTSYIKNLHMKTKSAIQILSRMR